MPEAQLHSTLVLATFVLSALTLFPLLWVTAPYGRHMRKGWGPTIPARLGWIVMESPSVWAFAIVFSMGAKATKPVPLIFLGLWQFHYINRSFVFPMRMRASTKRMPVLIAALAIAFNCLNSYINARWISHFGNYENSWLTSPPFVLGLTLFATGWGINHWSDTALMRLRKPGEKGYRVPQGGLYEWISCPNYLGEILEWVGWAIATWSLAGAAFALYTLANLLPRALSHHCWYRENFAEYPPSRRALLPFLL